MGQTYVYITGNAEEEKDGYNLSFGIFIDGTLTNKDNTNLHTGNVQ